MMEITSDTPSYAVGWIKQFAVKEWLPKNPHPTSAQVDTEVELILKHCKVDDDSMRSWTNEGNEAALFGRGPDVSAQMNQRLGQRDILQSAYASAFRNAVHDYVIASEPTPTPVPTATPSRFGNTSENPDSVFHTNSIVVPTNVPTPFVPDPSKIEDAGEGVSVRRAEPILRDEAPFPKEPEAQHPKAEVRRATPTVRPSLAAPTKHWYIISFIDPRSSNDEQAPSVASESGPDENTALRKFWLQNPKARILQILVKK